MKVEKYPKILYQKQELVWDSRQQVSNPLVVIKKNLPSNVEAQLRALSPKVVEEGKDFSSWGEWVSEILERPSEKLKIIAVVGTNGKTTTTALLRYLLVEQGQKVLEIGTLGALVWSGSNTTPIWEGYTGFTSPDAPILQDLFRQAVNEGVQYVVMEVTSHAISLGRVEGVEFDVGIFLNFSQDHLDFHKTMEEYKNVKLSFFTQHLARQKVKKSPYILINENDPVGVELTKLLSLPFETLLRNTVYSVDEKSLELSITFSKKEMFPILGHFQAENLLSAVFTVAALLNLPQEQLLTKLRQFPGIPGRMEIVPVTFQRQRRNVIVDFAHKPEALRKNLQTLKEGMRNGKLWVVFGCGGDRDPVKRPIMGLIAAEYADKVVVTSDNPRSEDPAKIIAEIVAPLEANGTAFLTFVSRKEAMAHCLKYMEESDLCYIAGRGHEEFQIIANEKIPFRDAEVLKSLSC